MSRNVRTLVFALLAAAGGVLVAVGTNYATGSSLDSWDSTASWVSVAVATAGIMTSVVAAFLAHRASSAAETASDLKEQLAFRLIRTLAAMEQEALKSEDRVPGVAQRSISLREVKLIMTAAQVWDTQDQIGFDLATRARNSVVHGDLDGLDMVDLRYANEKAEQLLKKMQRIPGPNAS